MVLLVINQDKEVVDQIPFEQVSRELDSLKRRGGELEAAARLATKWLLQAIQAGQPSGLLRAQVSAMNTLTID